MVFGIHGSVDAGGGYVGSQIKYRCGVKRTYIYSAEGSFGMTKWYLVHIYALLALSILLSWRGFFDG